jgi:hypothetical protein
VIRYTLACEQSHEFESWFKNSDAYDEQTARGLVTCPFCGSAKVDKTLMTPRLVGTKKAATAEPSSASPAQVGADQAEKAPVAIVSETERAFRSKLRELREHLVKNSDHVGPRFPEEARRMHYGEIEHRSIYGEASPAEAKALSEEGITFHPLPVLPEERN